MADSVSIYDEIEIEDMTFDPVLQIYHYPCPCGDRFEIGLADLRDGEDIGVCPSCSLMIRVIFDEVRFISFGPKLGPMTNICLSRLIYQRMTAEIMAEWLLLLLRKGCKGILNAEDGYDRTTRYYFDRDS